MPKFQSSVIDVDDTPQNDEVMPKIQSVVIDLDVHDDKIQANEIKSIEEGASQLENINEVTPEKDLGKTVEDVDVRNTLPESQIPIDLSNDLDNFTPVKRVSPSEINNAELHIPLKMLKKKIKIEKD